MQADRGNVLMSKPYLFPCKTRSKSHTHPTSLEASVSTVDVQKTWTAKYLTLEALGTLTPYELLKNHKIQVKLMYIRYALIVH